jgi:hypothetical protein
VRDDRGGGPGADLLSQRYDNFTYILNFYGNDPSTNPYFDSNNSAYMGVTEFLNGNAMTIPLSARLFGVEKSWHCMLFFIKKPCPISKIEDANIYQG